MFVIMKIIKRKLHFFSSFKLKLRRMKFNKSLFPFTDMINHESSFEVATFIFMIKQTMEFIIYIFCFICFRVKITGTFSIVSTGEINYFEKALKLITLVCLRKVVLILNSFHIFN